MNKVDLLEVEKLGGRSGCWVVPISDYIMIPEDRLKLKMFDFINRMKNKKAWVTPAGILLTTVLALITTESYNNLFSVPGVIWSAIIYGITIICAIWFIYSIIRLIRSRPITVESFIKDIKTEEKITYSTMFAVYEEK